jgi:hypothetical protein
MTTLQEIIEAFSSDAVTVASTAAGCPVPGALAGSMLSGYLRRRAANAREILIEELKLGNATGAQVASEDDAVAVIWRFLRASTEGSARLNLRLLAKAIVGQLRTGTLVADQFLQYADALSSMSRDEIAVIGALYRNAVRFARNLGAADPAEAHKYAPIWPQVLRDLAKEGMSEEAAATAAARAQRSGLIYAFFGPSGSTQNRAGYSAPEYRVSPLLADLARTMDFEDALWRETSTQAS